MASTNTDRLGLFKPTPGTSEPFRVQDINDNWDKIDNFSEEYDTEMAALAARVTTAGLRRRHFSGGHIQPRIH